MRARNLHPDAEVPYFETEDNVVDGWGRNKSGALVLKFCTKTVDGTVMLPLLQPSVGFAVEVARFLKENLRPDQPLLEGRKPNKPCHPRTVNSWWEQIGKECGFRALNPHDWKHSYATNGALHMQDWYKGNPYLLQACCLHEDFATTQKYIDQTGHGLLRAFKN